MAEVVINNTTSPQNTESSGGGTLSSVLGLLFRILIFLVIVGLIVGGVLIIENWDYIVTFFTTGFIGWLNPFDSPDGDTSPLKIVNDASTSAGVPEPVYALSPVGWVIRYFSLR